MTDLEKAITTQEDLDAIIKDRLERAVKKTEEKYQGYISQADFETKAKETYKDWLSPDDFKKGIAEKQAEIEKLNAEKHTYEIGSVKTKVAAELGLPVAIASRLSGESEDEIRKDAESIKSLMQSNHKVPPMAQPEPEPSSKDKNREALRETLKQIKGE